MPDKPSPSEIWSLPADRAREITDHFRTSYPGAPVTDDDRRSVSPFSR